MDQKERFTEIFEKNLFGGKSSRSGEGSSLEQTEVIRLELPKVFEQFSIKSILDAPCGDWNWMRLVDLAGINYTGVDIVDKIILDNQNKYQKKNINFKIQNLIEDNLPKADLILCRDCLQHLTYENIFKAINNFKRSGSKYLLTTNFPRFEKNHDLIEKDIWRALNLNKEPFNFKTPILSIIEREVGQPYFNKNLDMWLINELS